MLGAEARAGTVGGADHQRHRYLAVGHVTDLGDLVGDDIPAHRQKIREHDLCDGTQPGHRRTHGGADDRLFGDRRVAHALRPEPLQQTDGRLEHAAGGGDVLAEEHHAIVACHLLGDAGGNRLAVGQFRHDAPPSAQTWASSPAEDGGGEALAVSVAASTARCVSASMAAITFSLSPKAASRTR